MKKSDLIQKNNLNQQISISLMFLKKIMIFINSGCTWHGFYILITAPLCSDWKAQAASAQCFTLWQQATKEITWEDHSIIACTCLIYMGVILHIHLVYGKSHIQSIVKYLGVSFLQKKIKCFFWK